jgi:hypothetical protein
MTETMRSLTSSKAQAANALIEGGSSMPFEQKLIGLMTCCAYTPILSAGLNHDPWENFYQNNSLIINAIGAGTNKEDWYSLLNEAEGGAFTMPVKRVEFCFWVWGVLYLKSSLSINTRDLLRGKWTVASPGLASPGSSGAGEKIYI